MALRGTISKEFVTKKILETFEGSFTHDKEIRIRCMEDGAEVQIKVSLTAAKTNVEAGSDTAIPGVAATATKAPPQEYVPPSNAEKLAVEAMVKKFRDGSST